METGIYILLAAVVYGILADQLDRSSDRELEKRRRPALLKAVSGDLTPTPLEKSSFSRVLSQADRGIVRRNRLVVAAKSPQQVSPNRVEQVIGAKLELVDDREPSRHPAQLGDRDRTIQRNDRARRDRHLLVI